MIDGLTRLLLEKYSPDDPRLVEVVRKSGYNNTGESIAEYFDDIGLHEVAKAVRARSEMKGDE